MFNLEQSIAQWRQQMLSAGIQSPVPLEELEIHLRETVAQQRSAGISAENAFANAVQTMGQPRILKSEFNKSERKYMKKIIIGIGIVGVAVGMALVMPAVALYRHEGAFSGASVFPLLLGAALTLGGVGATVFGFKQRKA